jgi:Type I phosphodiesterase / nucleotide pyrophosphatase
VTAAPDALPDPPAYGGGCLADVMPAALHALGLDGGRTGLGLEPTSRVVVLLVDGLGSHALRAHAAEAPVLTALMDAPASRSITAVFPSTTPIALTSLGTGLTPGVHGITGLLLRLADGRLVNTLAMPAQVDLAALQPRPTAFELAAAAGVAVTRVGPAPFATEGLTAAALRGGEYAAAELPAARVRATATAVRRGERALVYCYYGALDHTGHRKGSRSAAWRAELKVVDRTVDELVDALPAGTTLVVTSDHGMVDVRPADRWDVATTPALSDGVEAVSGDLRGAQVHCRPGAVDAVRAAWQETLGGAFWVLPQEDAVAAGFYGPVVEPFVRERLGDLLALARTEHVVVDSRVLPPVVMSMIGMHGGLSRAEIDVPLVVHRT